MKQLIFTVTNDLSYDQRMIKICTSLANEGYDVLLIGRKMRRSPALVTQPFRQKRLKLLFERGKAFYLEYNLRLFWQLLFTKAHLICAIDLDTILPVLWASKIKRCKRVYDAHELFCEMKEVVSRPRIYAFWKSIERYALPQFRLGYTVAKPIQQIFSKEYGVDYEVVQNVPLLTKISSRASTKKFILYQGAVNEGRSFETLIPAFQWIDCPLHIYGDGNFFKQTKLLIKKYNLESKIWLKGKIFPQDLKQITPNAIIGLSLLENEGLNNYYSLANRFFDYIHAGLPQLCVAFPAYREIVERYEVACLIEDLSAENIARQINLLIQDKAKLEHLRNECLKAKQHYNWQEESKKLVAFYKKIFE